MKQMEYLDIEKEQQEITESIRALEDHISALYVNIILGAGGDLSKEMSNDELLLKLLNDNQEDLMIARKNIIRAFSALKQCAEEAGWIE